MAELKSCPFCGSKAAIWDKSKYDVCVRCANCNSQTDWLPTIADAINIWNTRLDSWISIDEKLPTVDPRYGDIDVLAHMDDGFIATTTFSGDWELWAESGEVTHWMLLPNPPKGSES